MLQDIFSGIGPISEVKVIKDKVSNKSAGYGFVKFLDPQVAELAMQQINRRVLYNQVRRAAALSASLPANNEAACGAPSARARPCAHVGIGLPPAGRERAAPQRPLRLACIYPE